MPDFTLDQTPVLIRKLRSGDTVTVTIYNARTGANVPLDTNTATEIGATGDYRYTVDFTTEPTDGDNEYIAIFSNGTITQFRDVFFKWFEDKSAYLDGAIWIDFTGGGTAGTGAMIGTPYKPSSNWADALTIAARNNLKRLKVLGSSTLTSSVSGYIVEGIGSKNVYSTDLNNQDISNAQFVEIGLTGTCNGSAFLKGCWVSNLTNANMIGEDLIIGGSIALAAGGVFLVRGLGTQSVTPVTFDVGGNGQLGLVDATGQFIIGNVANALGYAAVTGMHITTLLNTCTQGTVYLGGFSLVTDQSAGVALINRTYPYAGLNEALAQYLTAGTAGQVQRLASFDTAVHIDTTGGGTAGTTYPTGTPFQPSSNIADALTIAAANGLNKIRVLGDLTLTASISGYVIEGLAAREAYSIDINGQDVSDCQFNNVTLTGTSNGKFYGSFIILNTITEVDCRLTDSFIGGSVTVKAGGELTIIRGSGLGASNTINCGGNGVIVLQYFSGVFTLTNLTAIGVVTFHGNPFVTLDASITAGIIYLDGFGELTNNSTSTTILETRLYTADTEDGIGRILGLAQENFYIDNAVYSNNVLTSARIRIYSDAASVGTASNVIATYNITATWSGVDMLTYKVVKA